MKTSVIALSIVMSLSTATAFAQQEPKPPIMNNPIVVQEIGIEMLEDIAKWAMPAVSFFNTKYAMEKDFKAPTGTTVYWSKPFADEVQLLTPNDTSLYFTTQHDMSDGIPVVVEIPPNQDGLNVFGSIMNAWQTPIEDVGRFGIDAGEGGVYFITPPGYEGEIPENVIHRESSTFNVVTGFRITPKSFTDKDLAAAAKYGKMAKSYQLGSEATFKDVSGIYHNPLPNYDVSFFDQVDYVLQAEPLLAHDARFHEMAKQFGLGSGSHNISVETGNMVMANVKTELLEFFRTGIGHPMFKGANWQLPVDITKEAVTQFTYLHGNEYDWQRRALTFHWAIWAPKYLGAGTFYTVNQFDADNQVYDGGETYVLSVPKDVPAATFWSTTVYSTDTFSFYSDVHTVALNSLQSDLEVNKDGTVDVYFAPTLPEGVNHGNWIPTKEGTEWMTLFRWYSPTPELFNGEWTMGNIYKK
jgi:hypothetical protein